MAIVGPLGLLRLVREVSVAGIREDAGKPPRVVLAGALEERARLREILLGGSQDELDRSLLAQAVHEADLPLDGDEMVRSLAPDVVFTTAPPDDALRRLKVPVFQVTDAVSLRGATERLAETREDLLLRLGRFLPALRPAMGDRLIAATAAANTEIALLSALPGIAPITQVLLPPAAVADIVLLTKNQLMLVLKLAAMHGKQMDLTARAWELTPVVGGAFGWRALARELVGVVPGGIGVAAKGSIAYAGTFTVGKAAQAFYAQGRRITPAEEKHIYRDALERAREIVSGILDRVRRRRDTHEEHEEHGEDAA